MIGTAPALPPLPLADGPYRSVRPRPGLLARLQPSLAFYPAVVRIVWRAAAKAKRGCYDDQEWMRSSQDVLRSLERVGVRFEITGLEHVAGLPGPCVFIGNHMSTLETFVLPGLLLPFRRITFVVKQSLLDYPVFGHVMRSRDPIAVGRVNPREDLKAVLEGGRERIGRGLSLVVFPQTTRTAAFDPAEFNTIGVKLAKRAGASVIPMALMTDAWGNGRLVKDFGRIDPSRLVRIDFGAPLRVADQGGESHAAIVRFISDRLRAWGGLVKG